MKNRNQNTIELYNHQLNVKETIKDSNVGSFEEALYICDLSDIIKKYYIWKDNMPRVIPFYAVKCNDNLNILRILNELGTGFDCASKGEISKVLSIGVQPERIIFANPTKPKSHITHAYHRRVNTMTFDSDFELYKVQKLHPNAELVIRIRCDAEKAQCPLGEKFGCDAEKDAPELIALAKSLDLKVVGISFHVGSGCQDFPVYKRAIAAAKKLFDYGQTLGFNFTLLDIGGGFPGDKGTSLKEVSMIVNDALDEYFPDPSSVTVIAEPGRFFVSSAYTLVCRVHSKREVIRQGRLENAMYFVNDGVYGSFNSILYDHQMAKPQLMEENGDKLFKSSIWGPTCDALDQICESVLLPKLEIGDIILFENMGAYTIPIASPFNGFPLPRVKYFMNIENESIAAVL